MSNHSIRDLSLFAIQHCDSQNSFEGHNWTDAQLECIQQLIAYGSSLGPRLERIEVIKYAGRLVVLEDGSRWDVNDADAVSVEGWLEGSMVAIDSDQMYLVNDMEYAYVEPSDT